MLPAGYLRRVRQVACAEVDIKLPDNPSITADIVHRHKKRLQMLAAMQVPRAGPIWSFATHIANVHLEHSSSANSLRSAYSQTSCQTSRPVREGRDMIRLALL